MLSLREESVARLLAERAVLVGVSEPFDFEGPTGPNKLRGRIEEVRAQRGEVEISVEPFASPKGGGPVGRLVARARYEDGKDVVGELADQREPDVNLFYRDPAGPDGHLIGSVRLA